LINEWGRAKVKNGFYETKVPKDAVEYGALVSNLNWTWGLERPLRSRGMIL
jgi:hypothetical protein